METKNEHMFAVLTNDSGFYNKLCDKFTSRSSEDVIRKFIADASRRNSHNIPEEAPGILLLSTLVTELLEYYSKVGYEGPIDDDYNHAEQLLKIRKPMASPLKPFTVPTRVGVPTTLISEAVQRAAFALGFHWGLIPSGSTTPERTEKPFLFFDPKTMCIGFTDSAEYFRAKYDHYEFLWQTIVEETPFPANLDACITAMYADRRGTPITTTEEVTPMMTIESKTFINGVDASTITDQQIFDAIAEAEAEIQKLLKISCKPTKLKAKIGDIQQYVDDLATYVDGR